MGIRSWLGRRRKGVASVTVMSLVLGAVVALSLTYQGVATAEVDLNDGGVWVSNNESVLVGRLNYPIGEIDAGLAALSQDVDLLQRDEVVFIHDRAANGLQRVDPRTVAVQPPRVPLPVGADVQLGADTLGVLEPRTGEWRVLGLDQLGVLAESSAPPQAVLGEGAAQAIADDGTAFGLDTTTGELVRLDPDEPGVPTRTQLDVEALTGQTQLTVVGQQPVALSYDGETKTLTLLRADAEPMDLTGLDVDGSSARLQRPSVGGEVVAFSTADALVLVPLAGDDVRVLRADVPGEPAQPVQVSGCVHAAWASPTSSYLRVCGDGQPQALPVPEATGGELKFRTNRGYVVLNELSTGNAWMTEDTLILVDNWESVMATVEEDSEESEELTDRQEGLDRDEENRPPVAQDDHFGVRAGGTAVLSVVDNDSDPDGDLLAVESFTGLEESFGQVVPILGGRALQVRVDPGAQQPVSFEYTVADGRGGTDTARVDLRVHAAGMNAAPEQDREVAATITSGASVTVNLLDALSDPDGDAVYLTGVADSADLDVVADPNGLVTITDPGLDAGIYQVRIGVSDGTDEAVALIEVDLRPASAQPPVAVFDYATAFTGEAVRIDPVANDHDPNGRALRLASVGAADGASITVDPEDDTFTFLAEEAGDYYLAYVVADDDGLSATGVIRVRVSDPQDGEPVAVRDTALLPAGGTLLVDVLANDVDPAGGLLAVRGVDVPAGLGLRVAILDHRLLRISAERALPGPVSVEYAVSNGTASALGQVLVLPAAAQEEAPPPEAEADTVRVRAGDHVTVPVLANDYHPGALAFHLDPELVEEPSDGLIFVAGDTVRFQAPERAGRYTAVYSITDENGVSDSARITINVQARAEGANGAPIPEDITGRAFAGERIRIAIPTYGIDPDGDSVELLGVDVAPQLGRIVAVGPTYIDYQAFTASAGTDTFRYAVRDRLGAQATATIKVGVIPPPEANRPPVAIEDMVAVQPGRGVSVDVLANDFDPDGDQLALDSPAFGSADAGIEPGVSGAVVAFTAPEEAGTYLIEYHATDLHGGRATGLLTVVVSPDSPPQPPVAVDDVVPAASIVGRSEVQVEVLANDRDPDGTRQALRVSVPEGVSGATAVNEKVEVPVAATRQVLTYQITDEDGLSSYAFIIVPGRTDTGPVLRPDLEPIEVLAGERIEIELNDYVISLSGDPVQLASSTTVRATNSDGSRNVVDADTLAYASDPDYTGPATLTFEVTDAEDINADGILTSVLTLPIEVYTDENQPPRMRGGSLSAEAGGAAVTLDLARLAEDPDGVSTDLTYQIVNQASGFTASVDGYILTVQANNDTSPGTVAQLPVTVTDGESEPVPATIELTATASNRPLIVANPDDAGELHQGEPASVAVLANDSNPFPGEPRRIVSAQVMAGSGTAAVNGESVVITPAGDFVGRMTISYTVADTTGDPDRYVDGQVTAAVLGVPETPNAPLVEEVGNQLVGLTWSAPGDNGAPITGYTVTYAGGSQQCATTTCTITGLTNGTTYSFTITATNEVGSSPPSAASALATPDERPGLPAAPTVTRGDQELTLTWPEPVNEGTPITSYDVRISPSMTGEQRSVTSTSMTWPELINGQNYTFQVRANNSAPQPGGWSEWSLPEHPSAPPDRPEAPELRRIDDQLVGRVQVTWTEPATNGDPITGYRLAMYQDGALTQTLNVGAERTSREVQVATDHDYEFTVVAINRAGESPVSPRSQSVVVFGQPDKVTGVRVEVTGQDNTIRVSHNPADGNGQAVARYEFSLSGQAAQSLPSGGVVTVPEDGVSYRLQVRACNSYCGPWSDSTAAFSTYGPPGESGVTIDSAVDNQQVTFTWSVDAAEDNGAAIASGQYRTNDGSGWSGWRNGSSARSGTVTFDGAWALTYRIEVRKVNVHGQSGPGVAGSATSEPGPPERPAAPQASRVDDPDGGRLRVTWSPPAVDNDPIQSYTLRMYQDGALVETFTPGAGDTSREVAAANGHDYTFTIFATNGSGDSPVSPASSPVRSYGAPGRVGGVQATPTGVDNTATVSHDTPASNGLAISRYEYRVGTSGSGITLPSTRTVTVPSDGTNYTVQVRACNGVCGQWSASSNRFSTYGPPGTSTISISTSVSDRTVTFSFSRGSSDNGAALTAGRYRIDGGSWRSFSGTSGRDSVTGAWSAQHRIDVQVRNEHGQWSGSKSASARAEAEPVPEVVLDVDRGDYETCDGGGACYHVLLVYRNLPSVSGGYTVTFDAGNYAGCSHGRTRTGVNISGDGTYDTNSWYGSGCYGQPVRWTVTGGGKTYTDTATW